MSEYEIDPTALTVLEQTPALLRTLLTGHSDDVLSHRNPEGWSIVDVVSHLHDVDGIAFTVRIRRILEEHEPRISSIDPSQRLIDGGYAERSLDDVLRELAERRPDHVAWLRSLTADDLARTGMHDRAGTITPSDIVHQWAFHDLAHVRQIMEMLQAGLAVRMGNTRAFYPEAQALFAQATGESS